MPINPGYVDMQGSITKIPGTGQNVVADALIGFAKGIAVSVQNKRENEAKNQSAIMQAMIQQEMISPAGSKPADFNALGFGWKYGDQSGYRDAKRDLDIENTKSLIKDRDIDQQIKTDPEAWVQKNMYAFEQKNWQMKVDDPIEYSKAYAKAESEYRATAKSGQISYLRPYGPDTQAAVERSTDERESILGGAVKDEEDVKQDWDFSGVKSVLSSFAGTLTGNMDKNSERFSNQAPDAQGFGSLMGAVPAPAPVQQPSQPGVFNPDTGENMLTPQLKQAITAKIADLRKRNIPDSVIANDLRSRGINPAIFGLSEGK